MRQINTIKASLLATSLLVSGLASASEDFTYEFATVLSAKPVIKLVERTEFRRECRPEVIRYETRRSNGGDKLVGTILGAAVGHALGHRSKHRTGATVAGALIGSSIAANASDPKVRTYERVEENCRMLPATWTEEQTVGYQVVYRYNGRTFESRMPYDPGDSLKIRVQLSPVMDNRNGYSDNQWQEDYNERDYQVEPNH